MLGHEFYAENMGLFGSKTPKRYKVKDILGDIGLGRRFSEAFVIRPFEYIGKCNQSKVKGYHVICAPAYHDQPNYPTVIYGPDFPSWLSANYGNSYKPTDTLRFIAFTTRSWYEDKGLDFEDFISALEAAPYWLEYDWMRGFRLEALRTLTPNKFTRMKIGLDAILMGFDPSILDDKRIHELDKYLGVNADDKIMLGAMGFHSYYDPKHDETSFFMNANIMDLSNKLIRVAVHPTQEIFDLRVYPSAKDAIQSM